MLVYFSSNDDGINLLARTPLENGNPTDHIDHTMLLHPGFTFWGIDHDDLKALGSGIIFIDPDNDLEENKGVILEPGDPRLKGKVKGPEP